MGYLIVIWIVVVMVLAHKLYMSTIDYFAEVMGEKMGGVKK